MDTRVTEEMLEELLELEVSVREAQARIFEIKELCRQIGSFATTRYVCSVEEQSRTSIGPLDAIITAFGKDTLESKNLMKVVRFLTVKVTPKRFLKD